MYRLALFIVPVALVLASCTANPESTTTTANRATTTTTILSADARMVITTTFPSLEAMEQLIEMGAEEGMKGSLSQVDDLLATKIRGTPLEGHVEVIAADRLNGRAEESIDAARARIAELIHTAPLLRHRVA